MVTATLASVRPELEVWADIVDRTGRRATLRLAPGTSVAIIGLDGTGKSTAVEMLKVILADAGVPAATFHWYSAFRAGICVPFQVLRNRASRGAVQIFDRSIFDNLAVWSQRIANPRFGNRLLSWAALCARLLHPRFDAVVHLTAAPEVIQHRRPLMTPDQIARGTEVYGTLSVVLGTEPFDTVTIRRVTA